ncbi:O-antigen ligase family protein [bacterium]|nr:O-antigen ligase family protein [candidate division CSSED10-310 bacterium]
MYFIIFLIALLIAFRYSLKKPVYFLMFTLATGPLRITAPLDYLFGISMNLSALWLFTVIVLSSLIFIHNDGLKMQLNWFEKLYLLFLLYCFLQILRTDSLMFGLRTFLKLLFPFIMILMGHFLVRSRENLYILLKGILTVAWISILLTGGLTDFMVYPVARAGRLIFTAYSAFADYTAMIAILALVCFRLSRRKRYLILFAMAFSSPYYFSIRTGIIASAVGVAGYVAMTQKPHRALIGLAAIYFITLGAILFIPAVKDHMFFNPDAIDSIEAIRNPQIIDLDQIDSSGRFGLWERALREFYDPNKLLGSGLGQLQAAFYRGEMGVIRVIHNEFYRLLCDTGLVGVTLYGLMILTCLIKAWTIFRDHSNPLASNVAAYVISALPALMVCMFFDNIFDYGLQAGQYPFAFAGIMCGLSEGNQTGNHPEISGGGAPGSGRIGKRP